MENSSLQIHKPELYFQASITRRWELSYGGKDKFYLNDKERSAFLKEIYAGAETVQVGDMTLTKFFRYLIPIKSKTELLDIDSLVTMVTPEQRERNRDTIKKMKEKYGLIHQDTKHTDK